MHSGQHEMKFGKLRGTEGIEKEEVAGRGSRQRVQNVQEHGCVRKHARFKEPQSLGVIHSFYIYLLSAWTSHCSKGYNGSRPRQDPYPYGLASDLGIKG